MKFQVKETNSVMFKSFDANYPENMIINTTTGTYFKIKVSGGFYIFNELFNCFGGFNSPYTRGNKAFEDFLNSKLGRETKVINTVLIKNADILIKRKKEVI